MSTTAPETTRGPGLLRRLLRLIVALAVLAAVLFAAAAFYFSGVIGSDVLAVEPSTPDLSTKVALVEDDRIYLDPDGGQDAVTQDGLFGIRWDTGDAQVGRIIEDDESENLVVRRFVEGSEGSPVRGALAEVSNDAFYGDPRQALDLPFAEVDIDGELGAMPAYLVPGAKRTWVIYVHGKGASRTEGYRALRTLNELGYPGLLITYRGDEGAPSDPTDQYGYGLREWQDLEAAVRYALDNGADDVAIAGWSMGGAITGQFLVRSALAKDVTAVILDSPALDMPAVVRRGAQDRTLPLTSWPIPDALTSAALAVSDLRYPTNLSDAVATDPIVSFDGELFLAHGTADSVTPVAVSDEVAERRGPDRTTYVRVPDAEHTAAWNTEPARYDLELAAFARRALG
jgi:pimeloyl-ACP methyl ester carboxylesterase